MTQLTVAEKFTKIKDLLWAYYTAHKLIDPRYTYTVDEWDSTIYDAWNWTSPSCQSVMVRLPSGGTVYGAHYVKVAVNPNDGELYLDAKGMDNPNAKALFHDFYERYKGHEQDDDRISIRHSTVKSIGGYDCFVYVYNHDDLFFELLEAYMGC